MNEQEIYSKAKELAGQLVKQFDKYGTDQQTAMTIFGYVAGLLLHTYAMQNGKDVQQEAEYFGRYIKAVCGTLIPNGN